MPHTGIGFLDQTELRWYGTITQGWETDIWNDTIYLPAIAAFTSGVFLIYQLVSCLWSGHKDDASVQIDSSASPTVFKQRFAAYKSSQGGDTILLFKFLRLLGTLSLSCLSLLTMLEKRGASWQERIPQAAVAGTYLYTSILSIASLASRKWGRVLTRHNILVLLVAFATFIYRDGWPLATYDKLPMDAAEGTLLYVKLVVLTVTAMFIPLFIPREYIPVDPSNPMKELNPEQTASLFSIGVYAFLDSIIFEAYRVPHLPHTSLPVLADYDRSKYLTEKAFPHLDPFRGARKQHIFFGLMRVFYRQYIGMSIALTLHVFASFASPVAINRILNLLETQGHDDEPDHGTIRPWFWVACLFFGPLVVSGCYQIYVYLGTMALTRAQAILTELVFEHSLRVRFKAETEDDSSDDKKDVGSNSSPPNPVESTTQEQEVSTTVGEQSEDDAQSVQTQSTTKGKSKADASSSSSTTAREAPTQKKTKNNLVGRINTMITVDVNSIAMDGKDFLMIFLQVPLELSLAMTFLYAVLGWSAIVGLISILVLMPVPGYVANKMQTIQRRKLEKTDARIDAVTETIGVLRMVKLFGWERKMARTLEEKREEELEWLWKDKMVSLLNEMINSIIPTITMLVTYGTYTLIMGESLNASKVFSSMSVFNILRDLLHRTSWIFVQVTKAKVSLDRIGNFLKETELLDQYASRSPFAINNLHTVEGDQGDQDDRDTGIGFNNAEFTWSNISSVDGTQTPSSTARNFRLRVEGSLRFKKGCINLIIGPTGSGKTSLLMALLGEMHFIPTSVDSWFNLPRDGGVAYAAQESWVQNETIKENILFGSPYDEDRYKKVIKQCALERDMQMFEAGDNTEVGEKGLTLSGGQKARVTLARAVYSSAEIILLDDILAALDVHTSKSIVEDCLSGDLVRGRTVLLVTHNVTLTSSIAEHIVSVSSDGRAREMDDISMAIANDINLAKEIQKEQQAVALEEKVIDEDSVDKKEDEDPGKQKKDGKLILAEEIARGHVSWHSLKLLLTALGGKHPVLFFIIYFGGTLLTQVGHIIALWFLGYWGSQYETHRPEDVSVPYYLSYYSLILFVSMAIYAIVTAVFNFGAIGASRSINRELVESILGSTLRWLDETPASRIITRCTQDIAAVDGYLMLFFSAVVSIGISMIVSLCGPVFYTPIFLIPGVIIALMGVYLGNVYLKAQMSVRREMSNARAPVLAHFGAAISGLTSIRAYGAQQSFKEEALKRTDHYTKVARTSYNLNRWLSMRTDLLGSTLTAGLAAYLVKNRHLSAANTGFSLSNAIEFCTLILYVVRWYNEFEVQANSLERIQAYLDIEHEPKATEAGKPPASWPTTGDLRVESLSSRYSETGPKVLHGISFHVKGGERIGIVGRTGSGKSSLTLSLLRCILTEGRVFYDGLPTDKLNLDDLRSKITIIPQMPELLSGTLRRNLDPFDQYDDAVLNSALRASGLFSLQLETDEARLTLDSSIASGGSNLSVGQRQIIALARAIVRNSKLLILDEATSAIDHKTDTIIQESLRNELGSDVTVLTVAHRLQTIMDADKIMVLDEGKIVEYDSPYALLQKQDGYFKSLVDRSSDQATLYDMAEKKAGGSAHYTTET